MNELVFEIVVGLLMFFLFAAVVIKIIIDDVHSRDKMTRIRIDNGMYYVDSFEQSEWITVVCYPTLDDAMKFVIGHWSFSPEIISGEKNTIVFYLR